MVRVVGLPGDGVAELVVAEQGSEDAVEKIFALFPKGGSQFIGGKRAKVAQIDGQLSQIRLAHPLAQRLDAFHKIGGKIGKLRLWP